MIQTWALGANPVSSNRDCNPSSVGRRAASRPTGDQGGAGLLAVARSLFFLIAFAILFGGFVLVRTFASSDSVSPVTTAEAVIYADAGDSLWSLADAVKKPSMDTRYAVQLLADRNHMNDASLRAGQPLIVPAEMLP